MGKLGYDFPQNPRKTFLYDLEENWYVPYYASLKGVPVQAVKRSNFGQYDMAVNYLSSVLEEAAAINTVAVYNIDHMAQIRFRGKDAGALLDRALTGSISEMKVGACKYTLLLNEHGGVQDDMILMRISEEEFIAVINAGHDITARISVDGNEEELIADIDRIMSNLLDGEEVEALDISDQLVKVDVQGPFSYKLIKGIFGEHVLKNRNQPDKNMNYFTFNEFTRNGAHYYISRTGYTNRWGWEIYLPIQNAAEDFKAIVTAALGLGGMLVGLGGRDENRISAGPSGLPLMGSEYDPRHDPVNAPLFDAAVDMNKSGFMGRDALQKAIAAGPTKKLMILVSEGIASHRSVYLDGKRLGTVTSSINSPNVSHAMRLATGSTRKNVIDPHGTAAIGLAWLYRYPEEILPEDGEIPARIPVQLYREDATGNPTGSPLAGYLAPDGISPATASKPLKNIENL